MDYEKKYKEAFERAKEYYKVNNSAFFPAIFPELTGSEDERIRKELLEEIEFIIPHDDETDSEGLILPSYHARIDRYKSYLEKQKEQKLADSEKNFESIDNAFRRGREVGFREGVDSVKQHAEWSEKDEIYLQDALWCIKQASKVARGENDMGACWSAERWLKSIRPKPHWKPSEEQMEALSDAYVEASTFKKGDILESLYNDLKML